MNWSWIEERIKQEEMPLEKYEDFLELFVKKFVIQSIPIQQNQSGSFCTKLELCRSKSNPILYKR